MTNLSGFTIAGEPYNKRIYNKLKNFPNTVFMTKQAARSLKYNLERVKSRGVEILSPKKLDKISGKEFFLEDVVWKRLIQAIISSGFEITDISKVFLCCQDHGEP